MAATHNHPLPVIFKLGSNTSFKNYNSKTIYACRYDGNINVKQHKLYNRSYIYFNFKHQKLNKFAINHHFEVREAESPLLTMKPSFKRALNAIGRHLGRI